MFKYVETNVLVYIRFMFCPMCSNLAFIVFRFVWWAYEVAEYILFILFCAEESAIRECSWYISYCTCCPICGGWSFRWLCRWIIVVHSWQLHNDTIIPLHIYLRLHSTQIRQQLTYQLDSCLALLITFKFGMIYPRRSQIHSQLIKWIEFICHFSSYKWLLWDLREYI